MKIKLKTPIGNLVVGDVVDATINTLKTSAIFYDTYDMYHFAHTGQFEVIEESDYRISVNESVDEAQTRVTSLKEILGYDIKSIEFK